MMKELEMATPDVSTYVYEGYPLGIMKAHGEAYKEWLFSNYIQLNCHDDIIRNKEVFLAFYGDRAMHSPFLKIVRLSWAMLREMDIELVPFFKKNIDLGFYLFFKVDQYYIPNRYAYEKFHYLHDELIIGYDEEAFVILGYGDDGKCSKQKVSFAQFLDALNNNLSILDKKEWQDDIYFFHYVDADYKLNLNAICSKLYDYLNCINREEECNSFSNPFNDTVYGLDVYKKVIEYLDILMTKGNIFRGGENIDNRIFRLIMEHKVIMFDRITVLNSIYGGLDEVCDSYLKIKRKAENVHMLAVKYQVKPAKRIIKKIRNEIDFIREADKFVLSDLLNILEENKTNHYRLNNN